MSLSKQQIAEQIGAAEQYLQSLRTMADAIEPEAVKEWPKVGDGYWFLLEDGDPKKGLHTNHCADKSRVAIGNIFRTEAEALRRVEALKVAAELRRMPGRCSALNRTENYCIGDGVNGFCVTTHIGRSRGESALSGVWFESREAAQHALDTIGQDRLAVYLADFLDEPMGDE